MPFARCCWLTLLGQFVATAIAPGCGKLKPPIQTAGDSGASDQASTADGAEDRAGKVDAEPEASADADAGVDASAGTDVAASMCPPEASAVNVCGCGCCGGQPAGTTCYYPALGESAASIPDPRPADCSAVGCSFGVRHVCCADPQTPHGDFANYCAQDLATDLSRVRIVQMQANRCVSVVLLGPLGAQIPPGAVPGWRFESGSSGACDGSTAAVAAIGALGEAALGWTAGTRTLSARLVLFLSNGTGTGAGLRLEVNNLPLSISGCSL